MTSTARGRRYSWSVPVADHRTLLDFLSDLPPFQGKYHVTGPLKKALALFPAHAAFAMLQANKLLLHFLAAVWTNLVAVPPSFSEQAGLSGQILSPLRLCSI